MSVVRGLAGKEQLSVVNGVSVAVDLNSDQASNDDKRARRIRSIVAEYQKLSAKDELVTDEALIEANPDLMPELGEELHKLLRVRTARKVADLGSTGETAQYVGAEVGADVGPRGSGLQIRCPHCHNPVELVIGSDFSDISCTACGSHFSLIGEDFDTRKASTLKQLGHFELVERIGIGGFGTVWKARDTKLERTVAVKIPRRGQLEPTDIEQFFREARAAAQLQHPNIVAMYEVGRDGDTVYIVSEFVRGVSLSEFSENQPFTEREAAKLCATIADAVHHAHEAGVVHRDLKPANRNICVLSLESLYDANELDVESLCDWCELASGRHIIEGAKEVGLVVSDLTADDWFAKWKSLAKQVPTRHDKNADSLKTRSAVPQAFFETASALPIANLVDENATWKYLDDGTNLGKAWREVGFDDSKWRSGKGEFGYGDDDERTTIGFGPNPDAKYATTYFRHTFEVSDIEAVESIAIRLVCDDGGAVYLNGEEIARQDLVANPAYDDFATSSIQGLDESKFRYYEIKRGVLRSSRNVLAVEIHQDRGNSSDLSFRLTLAAKCNEDE